MNNEYQPNSSAAALLCSYAEIRKWRSQGVDAELLMPHGVGSVVLAERIEVQPVENTISDID